MRAYDRDLIRGGHYGQRSCEPFGAFPNVSRTCWNVPLSSCPSRTFCCPSWARRDRPVSPFPYAPVDSPWIRGLEITFRSCRAVTAVTAVTGLIGWGADQAQPFASKLGLFRCRHIVLAPRLFEGGALVAAKACSPCRVPVGQQTSDTMPTFFRSAACSSRRSGSRNPPRSLPGTASTARRSDRGAEVPVKSHTADLVELVNLEY